MKHLTLAFAFAIILPVQAQNYPVKTVRIVVPNAPGGGSDMQARFIGKRLNEATGQPFVIDNRTGASGMIGSEHVVRSPADGYTILFASALLATNSLLYKKSPYDAQRDLAPVTLVSSAPQFLMVHPSVPARSVTEFVALAKKNPGKLNGGSSGNGSANHLALEMLKQAANASVMHIPYRSGGPAIAALMSGETDFTFSGAVTALPQMRAGRVRALAVTSLKRSPRAPDVPTLDSFYAGYESANWYAMFVPAGTPAAVINKLHGDSVTAIRSPEMKEFMAAEGADPVASTPAELGAYLRHEVERYARVIKSANIRAE